MNVLNLPALSEGKKNPTKEAYIDIVIIIIIIYQSKIHSLTFNPNLKLPMTISKPGKIVIAQ